MIETARLLLRPWREADVAPFHAMGQDAAVMRHLGPAMTIGDAEAAFGRAQQALAAHGTCFWAIERRDSGAFIGFCGVKPGPAGTPIAGLAEAGWRLAREHWGQGLAFEAASASLAHHWRTTGDATIHAITVPANAASRRLMERLGMTQRAGGDFDHPAVPDDSPLRRHVHYSIERPIDG